MPQHYRAAIFGATGLTGSYLTKKLLDHPSFSEVHIFSRRREKTDHPKAKTFLFTPDDIQSLEENLSADVVFCCLGTTIKNAGSKEAFEKVDLHYPALIAKAAAKKGSTKMLMISSLGADENSSNFYLQTKGKAEKAVAAAGIPSVVFFRPSLLLGKREEFRFGEFLAKGFMQLFGFGFIGKLKRYKAVESEQVAAAMVHFALLETPPVLVVENEEILGI